MTPQFLAAVKEGDARCAQQIVTERWQESLALEFKTVSERLTRDDRKTIAKALCGLCNADGGAVILGFETEKVDGLDIASGLSPIPDVKSFAARLFAALPDMLQPAHVGIDIHPLVTNDEAGIVVLEVPPANDRPYMSIPSSQFFRRTFDSTRILDRSEIRDLFFVAREASVRLKWMLAAGASRGDHYYWLSIGLVVENLGQVIARAPYLTVGSQSSFREATGGTISRVTKGGRQGFFSNYDTFIHVGDEVRLAFRNIGIRLIDVGRDESPRSHALKALALRDPSFFLVNDGSPDQPNEATLPMDETIIVGAANAMPRPEIISMTKWDVLADFARLQQGDNISSPVRTSSAADSQWVNEIVTRR